jgi:RimJ/RimL family protein N-acetyltransferase
MGMVSRAEQRTALRRFKPGDHDEFVEMNCDPRVMRFFPTLLTPEESHAGLAHVEQHWDIHGFGPWALDVDGEFAGFLGLKFVPTEMPFAPAVELLYRLLPRFWGQGLATEGSRAALEFGFRELQLDRVVAFAVAANTGSRRVLEKIGMVYQSEFDHPSIPELSPLRRHVLYQLNRVSWHETASPIRILL